MTPLPIDEALPELRLRLRETERVVLVAPPGAGKTTRVPLALLDEAWLGGRRIVILEPRRLAARAAAAHMSKLLGDDVGGVVGYRVRMDTRVSRRTRIEVVTEGVLTRMLQDDPSLDDVGVVIFDEFHERSIHADLGLALALNAQAVLRPDLRLLVMSATLDAGAVARLLDDAPVVRAEGRAFPVETHYLQAPVDGHMEPAVAAAVQRALRDHDGDVLAFLPGAAEIRRTAERLDGAALPAGTRVMPLYGDLPQPAQDAAIAPSPPGRRKVVLATAIAETSLTIEGVRTVVDSGLMRVPRFSPRSGMMRLATVPVSRAAAEQRRGRAGRLGPGACYRLWTEPGHAALLEHRPPEIAEADLAPLALELAAWGAADPAELRWLDAPPGAAYAQATELLHELGALDADGRITAHGRAMSALPAHPRLAHMLLMGRHLERGGSVGAAGTAAALAALLGERDVLRAHDGVADPDIGVRLPLLHGAAPPQGHVTDRGALHRVRTEARHWRQRLGLKTDGAFDETVTGVLLAFAYPDRIGRQRGGRGRFLLRNGRGASLDPRHNLGASEFVVAADVGGHGRDSRIFLGAPLEQAQVEQHFAADMETDALMEWDADAARLVARESTRLGALEMRSRPLRDPPAEPMNAALLAAIRQHGLGLLDWTAAAGALRQRLAFLHAAEPAVWPDVSDAALLASLEDWLLPFLDGSGNPRRADVTEALLARIGWENRNHVDTLAPTHVEAPSGSRIAIDYSDPTSPVMAVRLQEMFGRQDTPRIAGGRVPLVLHLLSPAHRPVQVTRDLASFWENTYFDVRRDLRGRYPKHYWPDDPLQAEPTRRAKPRR
jgi:ATP-dependent helicase HrpB